MAFSTYVYSLYYPWCLMIRSTEEPIVSAQQLMKLGHAPHQNMIKDLDEIVIKKKYLLIIMFECEWNSDDYYFCVKGCDYL